MSKQTLLLTLGALAVGGILVAVVFQRSSPSKNDPAPITGTSSATQGIVAGEPNPSAPPSGKKIPFAEFIKQGGSYRCTVSQSVQGVESKGVTYIDDRMIRGDYTTNAQGMNINSTLIVRDGYTYTWTSMAPTMGFKAKVQQGSGDSNAPTSASYSFNAEQIGEYDCQPWVADVSMFVLPEGVTFQEI